MLLSLGYAKPFCADGLWHKLRRMCESSRKKLELGDGDVIDKNIVLGIEITLRRSDGHNEELLNGGWLALNQGN